MRKLLICLAFFAALGASSAFADPYPSRDRIVNRYDEDRIYRDGNGIFHWQIIEREVWVPPMRVGNGYHSRVIPGHYEISRQRVKIYHNNRYNNNYYPYNRNQHYRYRNQDNGRYDNRRYDEHRRKREEDRDRRDDDDCRDNDDRNNYKNNRDKND